MAGKDIAVVESVQAVDMHIDSLVGNPTNVDTFYLFLAMPFQFASSPVSHIGYWRIHVWMGSIGIHISAPWKSVTPTVSCIRPSIATIRHSISILWMCPPPSWKPWKSRTDPRAVWITP
jgi:hypothetical protein